MRGLLSFLSMVAVALAMTLPTMLATGIAPASAQERNYANLLTDVQYRYDRRYDRRFDRPRYSHRRDFRRYDRPRYRRGPSVDIIIGAQRPHYRPLYRPAPRYIAPPVRYGRPVYRAGPAHVQWCHARYRSYRAADNTFQPYNGPRRACLSPYL